jgi:hypothetical protein
MAKKNSSKRSTPKAKRATKSSPRKSSKIATTPKAPRKSGTSDVLKHLQKKGSITAKQANKLYDILRLAPIIHNLKKRGVNITPITVIEKNRYGNTQQTSKYVLA